MARIRESAGIVDPDPEIYGSPVSPVDRGVIAKLEGQLEQVRKMQPMELREALRTLEIDDRDVNLLFEERKDAADTEEALMREGALETDPRLVTARDRNAKFVQIFTDMLASVQKTQAVKLEIERRNLKGEDARLQEAMMQSIADKTQTSSYADAKARYLQAKKILEAAELTLQTERPERSAGR